MAENAVFFEHYVRIFAFIGDNLQYDMEQALYIGDNLQYDMEQALYIGDNLQYLSLIHI